MDNTNKKSDLITSNAQKAAEISKKFSEDVNLAIEAMRNTTRRRQINVANPTRYVYHRID